MFFENAGKSIKVVAKVLFWIGIALSVACGLNNIACGYDFLDFFLGILTIAVGALSSWVIAIIPYGFGQMVENSDIRTELVIKAAAENK